MKKNVASQSIGAQMVSATDGSAFTGAVTVYVTGDAGTQAVGSVGSGACTHEGNGYHTYAPAQAETNYSQIAFTFIGTGAVPQTVQIFTNYPQTADVASGVNVTQVAGTSQTAGDLYPAIAGIGTAGGAAVNVDANTDNASGGISGVTSGTTKVGTETNTYTQTSNLNDVYHVITGTATDLDWVYQFLIGGGTNPVSVVWHGYLTGSNDTASIYAWNHVGAAWELIGTQAGQAGTTNVTKTLTLYSRHRGTSAAELGKVYIRFVCTGMTNPVLNTDQLFVSYAITSRSVGYANGAVWVDTLTGIAGTEAFVNGVADNPVLTFADALTIATANNLRIFEIGNGSSITLTATTANKVLEGHEWTLALGGQSIASSMVIDAIVSGTGTGADAQFDTCEIGTVTLDPCFFWNCGFSSTMTVGSAGDYFFIDCASLVAGSSTPVFDLGAAVGSTNMSFRRWSGGASFLNIKAGDVISLDVVSGGTITVNGTGGSINIRGICSITDSSGGAVTITQTSVINMTKINTEVDTAISDAALATVGSNVTAIKAKTDSLTFTVAGQVDANALAISGDTVAADNLEATYDGTGYTDDYAPATQVQVGAIASIGASSAIAAESFTLTSGTVSSGTYTDTDAVDGVYHSIQDAAGVLDVYYQFDIGASIPSSAVVTGYLNGNNDSLEVYAYDWVAAGWDRIGTRSGQSGTANVARSYTLYAKHVGTGGDVGKVRIRFTDGAFTLTSATLNIDQIYVARISALITAAEMSDAVWDDLTASHVVSGSFGLAVSDILTDTAEIGAAGAGLTALSTAAALTTVGSNVTAIKAKTDSLTYTVAGQVDANITYVNDVAVGGVGTEGDPWSPA